MFPFSLSFSGFLINIALALVLFLSKNINFSFNLLTQ